MEFPKFSLVGLGLILGFVQLVILSALTVIKLGKGIS